ncbi:MAG TPA: hypothetical protein VHG88_08355 [Burkholderiales bacterium]|nr:hypothetical protein [Burkholderiales bacterium]
MAQFRVEFVLDQASRKYLAEMYHPERGDELLLRTEAVYPSQEAAVLGVVQLFKNAILQFPKKDAKPRVKKAKPRKAKKSKKSKTSKTSKTSKASKASKKAARSKKRK